MMTLPWTSAEESFLIDNLDKMPMEDMSKKLKRSTTAIRLKIHRMRLTPRRKVTDNPLYAIICAKFTSPEYFTPNMKFFERTRIDRVRFWAIYRGEVKATAEECRSVARELGVTGEEMIAALQQSLFDNPDFSPAEDNTQTTKM